MAYTADLELIAAPQWPYLRKMLVGQPVAELADLLLELEEQDRVIFFRAWPRPLDHTWRIGGLIGTILPFFIKPL